jgi:hypothetical protein
MEKIKSPYFKFEKKFLKDKELLSIVDCGDSHNLTIDELKSKKVETIFSKSIHRLGKEFYTDLIVKTTNNFYIYLSTTVMESTYMLKIYFKPNDKNIVDILLKTFKK